MGLVKEGTQRTVVLSDQQELLDFLEDNFGMNYHSHAFCRCVIHVFTTMRKNITICSGTINGNFGHGIGPHYMRLRMMFSSGSKDVPHYDLWIDVENRVRMDRLDKRGCPISKVYDMVFTIEDGSAPEEIQRIKDRTDKVAQGKEDPEVFDAFKGDQPLSQPGDTIDTRSKLRRTCDRILELLIRSLKRLKSK